jgi:hypothetical protein
MQYANLENHKSMPSHTGQRASCPSCDGEVLSKCGELVVHHWAHLCGEDCDPWAEHETEWHREWKNQFPIECREITIRSTDSDEFHRADVCLPNGTVIEFQHTGLSPEIIRKREDFYSRYANGMVWVVDGSEFMERWVKLGWSKWLKESYLAGKKKKWFEDYSPFSYVFVYGSKVEGFYIISDGSLPEDVWPLLKPVRWPHARKTWVYAHAPLYFDSGERNNKPEKELVHEKTRIETYTHQQLKEPDPTGSACIERGESQYRYTERTREISVVTEKSYADSDIFEWLGTVNDGAATSKGFYSKMYNGHNSRVNGRDALNLPKYMVGRFRPFDDVLSKLNVGLGEQ